MSVDWTEASAHRIASAVRAGEASASEVLEAHLKCIEIRDPHVHAWRRVQRDDARSQAERVDKARAQGVTLGPLAGVPVGLKDNFVSLGLETGCGSKILEGWTPGYQGAHAQRLLGADAVLLGKLSMDEFAMGSSNESTPYALVHNPWSLDYVPGGSSGGSAAAVASRMCALALGSDTGGSIRQPASLCGVSGLKPTYGRVSRFGLVAFASSLDQAGPLAREVEDLALSLGVLAGDDPKDATCSDRPVPDYFGDLTRGEQASDLQGLRVGVHRAAMELEGLDPGVRRVFERSLEELRSLGAQLVDIELPHFDLSISCYYVLATAEAASNLARFDGLRYGHREPGEDIKAVYEHTRGRGFGAEVQRRILLGTFVLRADSYEAYYGRAMKVRRLIAQDYTRAFAACDVIASPVSPVSGFALGERVADPLTMYLSDVFTIGVNLAGLPALSLPAGFAPAASEGPEMPVGLQLIAPGFEEGRLFRVAKAFQDLGDWHRQSPTGLSAVEAKT